MRSAIRKLTRVGKRSYAVIVPKRWVELLGVKPGDPLYMVLSDEGVLELSPLLSLIHI